MTKKQDSASHESPPGAPGAPESSRDQASGKEGQEMPCVVGVGASAGGLEALERFFGALPPNTGAAYVVVVHLSPDFKSLMPELLAKQTRMRVMSAVHHMPLEANTIYIIPPGKNMIVSGDRLGLQDQDRTPGHVIHLPIDIFLTSLAEDAADRSSAVILSGSGSDGSRGIRAIKEAGGLIFVQDPETAKFDGMPKSAMTTGLVDYVASPDQIAQKISLILKRPFHSLSSLIQDERNTHQKQGLSAVLEMLRTDSLDFSYYKISMIERRVRRRMTIVSVTDLEQYVALLKEDVQELQLLKQDLLIGVTSFFRDPKAFECLKTKVIPHLLLRKDAKEPLRVWVPACSTGEEVYSLGIIIQESIEAAGREREVKIFATDVDGRALEIASRGIYTSSAMVDMTQPRAARFFEQKNASYIVANSLREKIIFAGHNLVSDPPFTKMDLVSCRNLLIYLDPSVQEQIIASLHFALNVDGAVLLGSAETVSPYDHEFDTVDSKNKVYRKKRNVVLTAMRRRSGMHDPISVITRPSPGLMPSVRADETVRIALNQLAENDSRTCAILDTNGTLIEIFGDPTGVFKVPSGKPTVDAAKMVVDDLSIHITTALHRLTQGERKVVYAVELPGDEQTPRKATLQLEKLPPGKHQQSRLLMIVQEINTEAGVSVVPQPEPLNIDAASFARVQDLELELQQTKESLQATIEELQTTNEEQQSTNEELVASNEELQSTNEELHSVNEELYTVNAEYQKKNQELAVMAADLDNLLGSINVGTLYLDKTLRIRKFTPAVTNVIRLVEHDVGRSIVDFSHQLSTDFVSEVHSVIETAQPIQHEVRDATGAWLLMRILPYHTQSGDSEGVLVTFFDVTELKNAQESTRVFNEQLQSANRQLAQQGEELEDLFSIVAHDLKRPVVALDGLLKLIQKDTADQLGDQAEQYLQKSLAECRRLQRALMDLGDVSKIARQEQTIERIDLQPWMDECMERFHAPAREKGATINCTCDAAAVTAPRAALEMAVQNLVENALHYGCDHKQPRIDVDCQLDGANLRLVVIDNGRGIDPAYHQKVFELFRRLDPAAAEGSGVGLVAVRRQVEKAGGTVTLQSSLGHGAKFTLIVPVERVDDTQAQDTKVFRVLMVEDDPMDAKIIRDCLGQLTRRHNGCRVDVHWSKNLVDARRRLVGESFDVVLLDLSLPDGHGLTLLTDIRKNLSKDIPVVVLSGHGGGIPDTAFESSSAAYLPKDELSQDTLISNIRLVLNQGRYKHFAAML